MDGLEGPRGGSLRSLVELGDEWHGAGTLSNKALLALESHLQELRPGRTSETGAGRSTILFSWFSSSHTVYAPDWGGSVSLALEHSLVERDRIRWIDGPTQLTVGWDSDASPVDAVLLDGPHGYPFPHLEYFHLYPKMRPGSLLMIDDIHIRSIRDLFNWLRADAMWEHIDTVDRTVFLRRTEAPAIDPLSDSWWLQGYNQRGHVGQILRRLVPNPIVRAVRRRRSTQ